MIRRGKEGERAVKRVKKQETEAKKKMIRSDVGEEGKCFKYRQYTAPWVDTLRCVQAKLQ